MGFADEDAGSSAQKGSRESRIRDAYCHVSMDHTVNLHVGNGIAMRMPALLGL